MERIEGDGLRHEDTVVQLAAPGGERVAFVIQTKQSRTPRSLLHDLEGARTRGDGLDAEPASLLIAAPYLSPRSREVLTERSISYGDAVGNLRLVSERPGLFVEATSAMKDPWPDDRPLRSLRGRGAARAIRAVLDVAPPYGIRALAQRTQVSVATLSRVIDLLAREALVTRDAKGGVVDVDWTGVIRRWTVDYDVRRSNDMAAYLEPRGLPSLWHQLRGADWQYALTGTAAGERFAPIAPARTAAIYVTDAVLAAQRLGLREVEVGTNVLLVQPFDHVVFERTTKRDNLVLVAPSQMAADLLTGPGRDPSMGEELLAWMAVNQDAWRA